MFITLDYSICKSIWRGGAMSMYKTNPDNLQDGYCEDAYTDNNTDLHIFMASKRNTKRQRDEKYKKRLKELYLIKQHRCFAPVMCVKEVWVGGIGYIPRQTPYYKRVYQGKRSGYAKRQSHRKIRRYSADLQNGWRCHKLYDYWWECY